MKSAKYYDSVWQAERIRREAHDRKFNKWLKIGMAIMVGAAVFTAACAYVGGETLKVAATKRGAE